MFTTSDIGWVVGHSYIVYGPLIRGMTTVMYEGLPIRPDAGIWWKIVADHKVAVMFSSPTAARVLKKQDPAFIRKHDVSSLKHLFLAGLSDQAFPSPDSPGRLATDREYRQLTASAQQKKSAAKNFPAATRAQEEMLLFYEVLTRAEESLTISYPALDDKAQTLPPSPYVIELERLLAAGGHNERITRRAVERAAVLADKKRGARPAP